MSGGTALLLILALRDGQLSVLYPIISMSYVWVNLLSMYFFHDQINLWKAAGIAFVISGVGASRPRGIPGMNSTPFSSIVLVLLGSADRLVRSGISEAGRGPSRGRMAIYLQLAACHRHRFIPRLERALRYGFETWRAVGALSDGLGQLCLRVFWSRFFFNEPITKGKIAALGLILAGIVCIGVGAR